MKGLPNSLALSQVSLRCLKPQASTRDIQRLATRTHFYQEVLVVAGDAGERLALTISKRCVATRESQHSSSYWTSTCQSPPLLEQLLYSRKVGLPKSHFPRSDTSQFQHQILVSIRREAATKNFMVALSRMTNKANYQQVLLKQEGSISLKLR